MAENETVGSPVILQVPVKFTTKQDVRSKRQLEDPVAAFEHNVEAQWGDKKEKVLATWINKVLTPPVDIELDNDAPPRPMDKKEIVAAMKKVVNGETAAAPLVPTKEAASLQTYVSQRWMNKLRSQASDIYAAMEPLLSKIDDAIDKQKIMIRKDRCICSNVGLQRFLLGVLHSVYPIWLRIGLETVYGVEIDGIKNNKDVAGLTGFMTERLFNDPNLQKQFGFTGIIHYYKKEYALEMAKFFLKKFLRLFLFLDRAKTNRLIKYDPCLFYRKSEYKSTSAVFKALTTEAISGDGNLFKLLSQIGCECIYQQSYVDEARYVVQSLKEDLRDGVILCRVVEILTDDYSLMSELRCPPISILQKTHNVGVALKALAAKDVSTKDIPAKMIVKGHPEKTMALIDRIMKRFYNIRIGDGAAQLGEIFTRLQAQCKGFVFRRQYVKRQHEEDEEAASMSENELADVRAEEEVSEEHSSTDREPEEIEQLESAPLSESNVSDSPNDGADLGSSDSAAAWMMVDYAEESAPIVLNSISRSAEYISGTPSLVVSASKSPGRFCRLNANEWYIPTRSEFSVGNDTSDMTTSDLGSSPTRRPKLDASSAQGGSDGQASSDISSCSSSASSFSASSHGVVGDGADSLVIEMELGQIDLQRSINVSASVLVQADGARLRDNEIHDGTKESRDDGSLAKDEDKAAEIEARQQRAASLIGLWWRDAMRRRQEQAMIAAQEEARQRKAVQVIEVWWGQMMQRRREKLAEAQELARRNAAALFLQARWKFISLRRRNKAAEEVEARRQRAALLIGQWWRKAVRRRQEEEAAKVQARRENAAAVIGKWWRVQLKRRREKEAIIAELARKRNAVKTIEAWRVRILQRRQQEALQKAIAKENAKREAAARAIQCFWKRVLLRRRLQAKALEIQVRKKIAAMRIASWWKRALEAKKAAERRQKAALKIQSAWRGYRSRKDPNNFPAIVEAVRRRVAAANNAATEEKTIAARTRYGLDYLLNRQKLTDIRRGLEELDAVTRLSATSCTDLVNSGAIAVLFKLIHDMNQGLASQQITVLCISILFSLAKYESTRSAICTFPQWFKELVNILFEFRRSQDQVFNQAAMTLIVLKQLDDAALAMKSDQMALKKLHKINDEFERQKKRQQDEETAKMLKQRGKADFMLHKKQPNKTTPFWLSDPVSFKPDWQLCKKKPNENLPKESTLAWLIYSLNEE